jgi:hypothetical protein
LATEPPLATLMNIRILSNGGRAFPMARVVMGAMVQSMFPSDQSQAARFTYRYFLFSV